MMKRKKWKRKNKEHRNLLIRRKQNAGNPRQESIRVSEWWSQNSVNPSTYLAQGAGIVRSRDELHGEKEIEPAAKKIAQRPSSVADGQNKEGWKKKKKSKQTIESIMGKKGENEEGIVGDSGKEQ